MEEVGLGPNGGLLYCFDFLMENLEFLSEALEPLTDEYLVIFDMPGQIELYTHVPVLPALARFLTTPGAVDMRLCACYLLEATFVVDRAKFFAGTLSAMSAMMLLDVPHLNVLSKMDLVKDQVRRKDMKRFLVADPDLLMDDPAERARRAVEGPDDDDDDDEQGQYGRIILSSKKPHERDEVIRGRSFRKLNRAVANLIDSFGMVNYLKLDVQDEDSVGAILSYIDDCIQFHEAQDPHEPRDEVEPSFDDMVQ
jgi:hypothetical protein